MLVPKTFFVGTGLGQTQVQTVGVGVAIGQACMLLSAGAPGKRYMLPHATGELNSTPSSIRLVCAVFVCHLHGINENEYPPVGDNILIFWCEVSSLQLCCSSRAYLPQVSDKQWRFT